MIDVSVIIPTYNRRDFTCEAVASVVSQSGVTVEVIVADDGSTDHTPDAVRAAFPQSSVVVLKRPHEGAPAARNAGLDLAEGRYLKFLDSDDCLAPDSLARHVAAADDTGAAVSYGDFEFFGDLSMQDVGSQPVRRMGQPKDIVVALLNSWWLPPGGYLVRKNDLGHIRWDESLVRNQDMDYVIRMALAGCRFHYHPNIVVCKRAHREGRIMDSDNRVYGLHCEIIADKTRAALEASGGITGERRQALADLYWHASRLLYNEDWKAYKRIVDRIRELCPRYAPVCRTYAGKKVSLAVRWFGIEATQALCTRMGRG